MARFSLTYHEFDSSDEDGGSVDLKSGVGSKATTNVEGKGKATGSVEKPAKTAVRRSARLKNRTSVGTPAKAHTKTASKIEVVDLMTPTRSSSRRETVSHRAKVNNDTLCQALITTPKTLPGYTANGTAIRPIVNARLALTPVAKVKGCAVQVEGKNKTPLIKALGAHVSFEDGNVDSNAVMPKLKARWTPGPSKTPLLRGIEEQKETHIEKDEGSVVSADPSDSKHVTFDSSVDFNQGPAKAYRTIQFLGTPSISPGLKKLIQGHSATEYISDTDGAATRANDPNEFIKQPIATPQNLIPVFKLSDEYRAPMQMLPNDAEHPTIHDLAHLAVVQEDSVATENSDEPAKRPSATLEKPSSDGKLSEECLKDKTLPPVEDHGGAKGKVSATNGDRITKQLLEATPATCTTKNPSPKEKAAREPPPKLLSCSSANSKSGDALKDVAPNEHHKDSKLPAAAVERVVLPGRTKFSIEGTETSSLLGEGGASKNLSGSNCSSENSRGVVTLAERRESLATQGVSRLDEDLIDDQKGVAVADDCGLVSSKENSTSNVKAKNLPDDKEAAKNPKAAPTPGKNDRAFGNALVGSIKGAADLGKLSEDHLSTEEQSGIIESMVHRCGKFSDIPSYFEKPGSERQGNASPSKKLKGQSFGDVMFRRDLLNETKLPPAEDPGDAKATVAATNGDKLIMQLLEVTPAASTTKTTSPNNETAPEPVAPKLCSFSSARAKKGDASKDVALNERHKDSKLPTAAVETVIPDLTRLSIADMKTSSLPGEGKTSKNPGVFSAMALAEKREMPATLGTHNYSYLDEDCGYEQKGEAEVDDCGLAPSKANTESEVKTKDLSDDKGANKNPQTLPPPDKNEQAFGDSSVGSIDGAAYLTRWRHVLLDLSFHWSGVSAVLYAGETPFSNVHRARAMRILDDPARAEEVIAMCLRIDAGVELLELVRQFDYFTL